MLGSEETVSSIVAHHLGVFLEQEEDHVITLATSSMEKENQLPRGEYKANDVGSIADPLLSK